MKRKKWTWLLAAFVLTACSPSASSSIPASPSAESIAGLVSETYRLEWEGEYAAIVFEDPSLAEVRYEGKNATIAFLKEGETRYQVIVGEKRYTGNLTVYDFSYTGLISTVLNQKVRLEACILEGKEYAFYSDDESIARVDLSGEVTPVKEGTCAIGIVFNDVRYEKEFTVLNPIDTINSFSIEEGMVNFYGRNEFSNAQVDFDNEASGFEFAFVGTECFATLGGAYNSAYGPTRLQVYVDGELFSEQPYFALDKGAIPYRYRIAGNLEPAYHTVKVLKMTEVGATSASMYDLSCTGYFLCPEDKPELKIEAYGDSITAGYGNLRAEGVPDGTNAEMQNTLRTYAFIAAETLNAQINIHARSGIGLSVAGNIVGDFNMNTRYEYLTPMSYRKWNMHNYIPDVVILNLGTNDSWSGRFDRNVFVDEYLRLVGNLREAYGDEVRFLLCSGFMEENVYPILENTIYPKLLQSGVERVMTLKLEKSESNGHPVESEHAACAEKIVEAIESLLANFPKR